MNTNINNAYRTGDPYKGETPLPNPIEPMPEDPIPEPPTPDSGDPFHPDEPVM